MKSGDQYFCRVSSSTSVYLGILYAFLKVYSLISFIFLIHFPKFIQWSCISFLKGSCFCLLKWSPQKVHGNLDSTIIGNSSILPWPAEDVNLGNWMTDFFSVLLCGVRRSNWESGSACQWLIPVILATWEAEIRRFEASLGKSLQGPFQPIAGHNGVCLSS
jgi:hypothetical protein